jgi:hypothetical protein
MNARGHRRAALTIAIEAAEAEIADLGRRRAALEKQVDVLRNDLRAEDDSDGHTVVTTPAPDGRLNAQEKVALFRSLFHGREDVFPKFWVSPKTDKKGYSPTCRNDWVRGVCEKPRVRCGDCPSQAFLPMSDQVILDHLQGRHVIGCYPLLADETCWIVAADFDEAEWAADISAFAATCGELGVPVAVERSRSGYGAHAWLFFSAPVPASAARRMASFLITETMSRRHELSMASYDRLFPSQDTMPRGGFGNLIALPLQRHPRTQGNTVFLDANLEPHPDQWAYLLGVKRMSRDDVETIASEAARKGLVVGVRTTEDGEDEDAARPWRQTPLPAPPPGGSRVDRGLPALASGAFLAGKGKQQPLRGEFLLDPALALRTGRRLARVGAGFPERGRPPDAPCSRQAGIRERDQGRRETAPRRVLRRRTHTRMARFHCTVSGAWMSGSFGPRYSGHAGSTRPGRLASPPATKFKEGIDPPPPLRQSPRDGGTDAEPRRILPRRIPRPGQRGADSSG